MINARYSPWHHPCSLPSESLSGLTFSEGELQHDSQFYAATSSHLGLLNEGHAPGIAFDKTGNPAPARDLLDPLKDGSTPKHSSVTLGEADIAQGAESPKLQRALAEARERGEPLLVVRENGVTPEQFIEGISARSYKPRTEPPNATTAPIAETPDAKTLEINTARRLILANTDVGGKNAIAKRFHDARNVSSVFSNEYYPSEAVAPKPTTSTASLTAAERSLSPREQALLIRTRESFGKIYSGRAGHETDAIGNTSAEVGSRVEGSIVVEYQKAQGEPKDTQVIRYSFPKDQNTYDNISKLAINAIYSRTRTGVPAESLLDGITGPGNKIESVYPKPGSAETGVQKFKSALHTLAANAGRAYTKARELLSVGAKKLKEPKITGSTEEWADFAKKVQESNEEIIAKNPEAFKRALADGNEHALWLQKLGVKINPDGKVEFPSIGKILAHLDNLLQAGLRTGEFTENDTIRPARFFTRPGADGKLEYLAVPYGAPVPEGATPFEGITPFVRAMELLAEGYFPLGEPVGLVKRAGKEDPPTATFHDLAHFSGFYDNLQLMKAMRQAARQILADKAFYREIPSIRGAFEITPEDIGKLYKRGLVPNSLKGEIKGLSDSQAAEVANHRPPQERLDLQATVIQAGLRGKEASNKLRPLNDRAKEAIRWTLFLENGFEIPRESSEALFDTLKREGSIPTAPGENYGGEHRFSYPEVRSHLEKLSADKTEAELTSQLQRLVEFYRANYKAVGGMPRDIYQREVRAAEEPNGFGYYFTPEYLVTQAQRLTSGETPASKEALIDSISRLQVIGLEAGRLTPQQWLLDISKLNFDPNSETGRLFSGTGAFPQDLYHYSHGGEIPDISKR